jgi:hypothetical protein
MRTQGSQLFTYKNDWLIAFTTSQAQTTEQCPILKVHEMPRKKYLVANKYSVLALLACHATLVYTTQRHLNTPCYLAYHHTRKMQCRHNSSRWDRTSFIYTRRQSHPQSDISSLGAANGVHDHPSLLCCICVWDKAVRCYSEVEEQKSSTGAGPLVPNGFFLQPVVLAAGRHAWINGVD